MAIPVVASVSAAATGTGTSITTNAPSGVAVGNALILTVHTAGAATVTTPTNWNLIQSTADISSQTRTASYWRIATGGGDDTPTVTLGSSVAYCAFIVRVTGATATPLDDSDVGSATASSSLSVPSITTTATDELCIACMTITSGYSADPSNWTQQASDSTGAPHVRVWSQDAASIGNYGGDSVSFTGLGSGSAVTLSLFGGTATTYNRSFSENMAVTETPLRACTNLRTASTSFGIQEGLFYKPNYRTFSPEKLALSDTPVVLPIWRRGLFENLGMRDSMTRTTLYARALSEMLGMQDTATRQATLLRTISELLALQDTIGDIQVFGPGGTTWHRVIVENLAMLEAFSRTTLYQRIALESLGMTEAINRSATLKRQLSENIAFQEQINRATVALRRIAESLGMSDSALLHLISGAGGVTSRRFYRPGALDYQWERPARVETQDEHRGTSDEQVQ